MDHVSPSQLNAKDNQNQGKVNSDEVNKDVVSNTPKSPCVTTAIPTNQQEQPTSLMANTKTTNEFPVGSVNSFVGADKCEMVKEASTIGKDTTMKTTENHSFLSAKSAFPLSGATPSTTNTAPAPQSDRIESLGSEISLGFGEAMADLEDHSQNLVIREGPEPYKSILRTVCAYAIRCQHGRMPIQKVNNHTGYWLPYVYATENRKYAETINELYEFFLREQTEPTGSTSTLSTSPSTNVTTDNKTTEEATTNKTADQQGNKLAQVAKVTPKLLTNVQLNSIYRFQIPDGQYISRYIFLAQWQCLDSKLSCCRDTANIQWHSLELLQEPRQSCTSAHNRELLDRLWGSEVLYTATTLYSHSLGRHTTNSSALQIQELTSSDILKYCHRSSTVACGSASLTGHTRSSNLSPFSHMLQEAHFMEKDVIKIYCDFVQHCYPSVTMTYCSFYEYFTKIEFLQFDDATLRHVFRAMNFKNPKNFILFHEFLLGLAALDSNAPNSKLRCTYIFRYYDRNGDGYLDEDDFRRMITDIREKANLSCDQSEVNNDVQNKLRTLRLLNGQNLIGYQKFLSEASRIGGTTHLFRTNRAILEAIHIRHAYEYIFNKSGKPFSTRLVGTCPKCKPKNFSLSYHTVKLNSQGRIDDPKPLVTLNCGDLDANLQFKQKSNEMELRHSIEVVFNEASVANKVLNIIRKMQDFNKLPRDRQREVCQVVVSSLTPAMIVQLCKEATDIFLIEPRVLKVNTPCFVIGDLHGNINDLLTYEEQLWPLAPSANSPNLLFLGDYVDRGDYSIEVISYLFAMKILAPTKFFLLRGNHEIRSIQRNFTFHRECLMKYQGRDGLMVFDAFNAAFDHLPLVGIIDESIFCAHGGIPNSVSKIEELYKIPTPLLDPEIQSKPAWEILWSDPVTDEEFREVCQFHNQSPESGFTDNIRRSTAYYFNEKALRNFLKNNNLSHVIRAHELEMDGYRFHHSGLLITVFSSSRYCNSLNRSAAVFVDGRETEGFIKVIALDT